MLILGVDTSTKFLSLAVNKDDCLLAACRKEAHQAHSRLVVNVIDKLLKKNSLRCADIDVFCAGLGPGSFTGLRIGLSLVKALAFASGKKAAGIPSLDIIAGNVDKKVKFSVILDARRGNLYSAFYDNRGDKLKRTSPYLLIKFSDWLSRIKEKTYVLGDGIAAYAKELAKQADIACLSEMFWYPDAGKLNLLACRKIKDGGAGDIAKISPLYLYPKECQIKSG